MKELMSLVKHSLIKQMRSYHFLIIAIISIALGFLCVPAPTDGYEIFYLGGVRGIYNSAWLGAMGALLPVILLWLPGFYLLRSQISEDGRLKIGQIIASTPLSKLRYIFPKAISNFCTLMAFELIFLIAIVVMQFLRRESMQLIILDYIAPMFIITIPYIMVLSALTILFDVVSGLKGVFGNVVIFALWITMSTVSVAMPGNKFDLFGIGFILNGMMHAAKLAYPNIGTDSGSFGYYPLETPTPTFHWDGIVWDHDFLLCRLFWIVVAGVIVFFSSFIFNRFKESTKDAATCIIKSKQKIKQRSVSGIGSIVSLSPVRRQERIDFLSLLKGELRIMLMGMPVWWYVLTLSAIAICAVLPAENYLKWGSLIMVLPISIWSQMGCREKYFSTEELIRSSCPPQYKWWASWSAGVLISLIVSSGILVRFIVSSEWLYLSAWITGGIFVPTFALVLGTFSGNRKLFESVYIAWFYFGPVNGLEALDFLGISANKTMLYGTLTIIFLALGSAVHWIKQMHRLQVKKER